MLVWAYQQHATQPQGFGGAQQGALDGRDGGAVPLVRRHTRPSTVLVAVVLRLQVVRVANLMAHVCHLCYARATAPAPGSMQNLM